MLGGSGGAGDYGGGIRFLAMGGGAGLRVPCWTILLIFLTDCRGWSSARWYEVGALDSSQYSTIPTMDVLTELFFRMS